MAIKFYMPKANKEDSNINQEDVPFVDTFVMPDENDNSQVNNYIFEDTRPKDSPNKNETVPVEIDVENVPSIDTVKSNVQTISKTKQREFSKSGNKSTSVREVKHQKINKPVYYGQDTQRSCSKIANMTKHYLHHAVLKDMNVTVVANKYDNDTSALMTLVGNCVYNTFLKLMRFRTDKVTKVITFPDEKAINGELAPFYNFFDIVYHDGIVSWERRYVDKMMEQYRYNYGENAGLPRKKLADMFTETLKLKINVLSDEQIKTIVDCFVDLFGEIDSQDETEEMSSVVDIVDNDGDDIVDVSNETEEEDGPDSEEELEEEDEEDDEEDDYENDEEDDEDDRIDEMEDIYQRVVMDVHAIESDKLSLVHNDTISTYYVNTDRRESTYLSYLTDDDDFNKYGFLSIFEPWFCIDGKSMRQITGELTKDPTFRIGDSIIILRYPTGNYGVYWLSDDLIDFIGENYTTGIFMALFTELRDNQFVSKFDQNMGNSGDTEIYYLDYAKELLKCFNCGTNMVEFADVVYEFDDEEFSLYADEYESTDESDDDETETIFGNEASESVFVDEEETDPDSIEMTGLITPNETDDEYESVFVEEDDEDDDDGMIMKPIMRKK